MIGQVPWGAGFEGEKFACKRFIGKCCQDQPLLGNEGSRTEQRKEPNCDAFAAKSSGSGLAFQESLMLGPGYWDFIPLIPWHQQFIGHELSQEEAVVLNKEVLKRKKKKRFSLTSPGLS